MKPSFELLIRDFLVARKADLDVSVASVIVVFLSQIVGAAGPRLFVNREGGRSNMMVEN